MGSDRGDAHTSRRRASLIIIGTLFALALAAAIAGSTLYDAYKIPSGAMSPTVNPGDRVVARHIRGRNAHRGDIVVFESSPDLEARGITRRISRVVAVGGDHVDTADHELRIDGRVVTEQYLAPGTRTDDLDPVVIPAGTVLLLGDNRPQARDSRVDGPLPVARIVSRVDYVNTPVDRIAVGVAVVLGFVFVVELAVPMLARREEGGESA